MEVIKKFIDKKNNEKTAPPVTIAFLGDSVTQGCFELYKTGERGFETEFRIEDGYHTKLRQILQMFYPSVPVNMIYAGISGDNAPGGLERVERDVCSHNPDLTIVCFGLNDCCGGMKKIDIYIDALKKIFKKLKTCGTEIIFMTPNVMADSLSPEITDEYMKEVYTHIINAAGDSLKQYIEAAKDICKEENIKVCDCYRLWDNLKKNEVDTTRLLSNRINHPIEKMNWLFAFKLAETMFED